MSQVLTSDEILDLVRQRFPGEEAAILQIIGAQAAILRAQLASDGGDIIGVDPPPGLTATTLNALLAQIAASAAGVTDGDKGDITVSASGAAWVINLGVVGSTKLGGDITAAGKALITGADAAAQRITLGLGTAATQAASAFDPAGTGASQAASAVAAHTALPDPHPQYLTVAEGNAAYQPLDADLTAIAGLTSAADRLPYFTGLGTATLATFTAFGRSLVDDTNAAEARTTLGATTLGGNLFTAANPGAIRFIRIDAANTVTLRDAPSFLGDIGGVGPTVTIRTANAATNFALTDRGNAVAKDDTGSYAWTILNDATTLWADNATILCCNDGASGNVTITPGSGVTLTAGTVTGAFVLEPGQSRLLHRRAANNWRIR